MSRSEERYLQPFWWGNLRVGDKSEDLRVDGKAILRRIFKKLDGKEWTRGVWLRVGASGGFWCMFHKIRGIYLTAKEILDFPK
jgi:hypothetical protein